MHTALAIAIYAATGTFAIAGNWAIRSLLRRIDPHSGTKQSQRPLLGMEKDLPGGRWIGILERTGTYACIVTGFPAGIAMILAVKGLGRYPELRSGDNPRVGELFIIGTFSSLLWASAWAGMALGALSLLPHLMAG